MSGPLVEFTAVVEPEGPRPVDYIISAFLALDALGWLTPLPRPVVVPYHDPRQRPMRATLDALYGADGQGLDPAGAYPPVTLWCLRLNGYVYPVPGLDQDLHDWRDMAEDAAGERFPWLPSFPEPREGWEQPPPGAGVKRQPVYPHG